MIYQRTRRKSLTALFFIGLLTGISLFVLPVPNVEAVTSVPAKMNYQGRLTNSAGTILPNGTYNMKLRIYSATSGGTLLWSEDRLVSSGTGVVVTNGLFSIRLGDSTSLPVSLFNSQTNTSLYLETELPTPATATSTSPSWTEGAMSPRNQLATSAYAFNSDTLDGLDSDAFAKVGGNNSFTGTNEFAGMTGFTGTTVFSGATQIQTQSGANFNILSSSGNALLFADNDANSISIGLGSSSSPTLFVVSNYNQSSDPAGGSNGSIYYNTVSGKFRCYEAGAWKDCITPSSSGGGTTVRITSNVTNSNLTANMLADTGRQLL